MTILAIIAEYNPFHNGHLYQIKKAKELTKADFVMVIMSGNFVQRGTPAIADKYTRASICTKEVADLVIELPYVYSTGSAYDFAMGAVSIIEKLGVVDYLCFGAEADSPDVLKKLSDIVYEETPAYRECLKKHLSKGLSFPAARQSAISDVCNVSDAHILSEPNNILAVEYLNALKRLNSKIKPVIIKREGALYHDTEISGSICSATAARDFILSHMDDEDFDINSLDNCLPKSTTDILKQVYRMSFPISSESLTPFLQSAMISGIPEDTVDSNSILIQKISKIRPYCSFNDIASELKSKDITRSRINRFLCHAILGYRNCEREVFAKNGYAFYANILSFRKDSSKLIRRITEKSSIPVITKKADFEKTINDYDILHEAALLMWDKDKKATDLYNSLIYNTYGFFSSNDFDRILPIN